MIYSCSNCGSQFISKGNLKRHIDNHVCDYSLAGTRICPRCGKEFKNLGTHTRICIDGKPAGMTGKCQSESSRKRISAANKGRPSITQGIPRTEEVKLKISLSKMGHAVSEEQKEKYREKRKNWTIPFKDTSIEVALQNELNRKGIQFRKHEPMLGQPDIFIEPNICIFADGDYWHGEKFPTRQERDVYVTQYLQSQGYLVVRFWEHEIKKDAKVCVGRILEILDKEE